MSPPETGLPRRGVTFPMWDGDRLRWPREVLAVVGDRTADAGWQVQVLEAAGDPDAAARMEELGDRGGQIPDAELRQATAGDVQLVDATLSVGQPPSLVIRAVDSTHWDVVSDDLELLRRFKERFGAVDLPPDALRPVEPLD